MRREVIGRSPPETINLANPTKENSPGNARQGVRVRDPAEEIARHPDNSYVCVIIGNGCKPENELGANCSKSGAK
jgi:hypothetical protein